MDSYVKTSRELRSLHRALREWVRLNRLLGRQWAKESGDLPWWYGERALLSVFAGAVWRKGGHAFEEFSETKLKGTRRKEANGRIDLWFENSGGEFRAEAKVAFIPFSRESKQRQSLRDLMASAVSDAGDNPADGRKNRRLAIAFAIPYLSAKLVAKGKQQAQIDRFLSLAEEVEHDAIAWAFPPLKKLPAPYGWVYPGIVMLIKIVKRSP